MYDFVTIDFETANSNLNSACSLAIVAVKDFKIIDRKYYLINPPAGTEFNPINIRIHGITPDDVFNKPYFSEIWNDVAKYFDGEILAAHNASFDMSVLKHCLHTYEISFPKFTYIDSMQLPFDSLNYDGSKKLVDIASYFKISVEDHHNSLCDAETAAQIIINTAKLISCKTFSSFYDNYIPHNYFSESKVKVSKSSHHKHYNNIKISEICSTCECISTSSPFYEKLCVFTGELEAIGRKSAMQMVVDLGGIVKSGVSRKTDYLIVGKQDNTIVGDDGLSGKEEKAYELIKNGFNIKIIYENEFLKMLETC